MDWPRRCVRARTAAAAAVALVLVAQAGTAATLRERLRERLAPGAQDDMPGVRILRDIAYGGDERQRFDVYAPVDAKDAPVIFMVHGGAWAFGNKSGGGVVRNKGARWVPRGFIFVSTNYRLLPKADPVEQAKDVARAIAAAQEKAAAMGGDRSRFILMGHSAGAHLVALLTTSPSVSAGLGVTPWLGTVLLDSAAVDVVSLMEERHARLYDQAFGADPTYWRQVSPLHTLAAAGPPLLAVCSTLRDDSCPAAARLAAKAKPLDMRVSVLGQRLTHEEINTRLGEDGSYTEAVEAFLKSLHPSIAERLTAKPTAPPESTRE